MGKKKREVDSGGGGANWMDTYGDMVTLLLCFFVLLFALSSIDAAKWDELVAAFANGPTVAITPLDVEGIMRESEEKKEEKEKKELEDFYNAVISEIISSSETGSGIGEESEVAKEFNNLYRQLQEYVQINGLDQTMELMRDGDTIILRFKDNLLFDSGKADLKADAVLVLDEIVKMIAHSETAIRTVRIEGHTDNVPISGRYADNWELSMARASSVLQYILKQKSFPEKKLIPAGCGEYHPLDTNETPEGRARNRRVELAIERETLFAHLDDLTPEQIREILDKAKDTP